MQGVQPKDLDGHGRCLPPLSVNFKDKKCFRRGNGIVYL